MLLLLCDEVMGFARHVTYANWVVCVVPVVCMRSGVRALVCVLCGVRHGCMQAVSRVLLISLSRVFFISKS